MKKLLFLVLLFSSWGIYAQTYNCANYDQCYATCLINEFGDTGAEVIASGLSIAACVEACESGDVIACGLCALDYYNTIVDITDCAVACSLNVEAYGGKNCPPGSICFQQDYPDLEYDPTPLENLVKTNFTSCVDCPNWDNSVDATGRFNYEIIAPTNWSATVNPAAIGGTFNVKITIDGVEKVNATKVGFHAFDYDVMGIGGASEDDEVKIEVTPTGVFAGCPALNKTYKIDCPEVKVEFIDQELCLRVFYEEGDLPVYPIPFDGIAKDRYNPTSTNWIIDGTNTTVCFADPISDGFGNYCVDITMSCNGYNYGWLNGEEEMCTSYELCDEPQNEFFLEWISAKGQDVGSSPPNGEAIIQITGLGQTPLSTKLYLITQNYGPVEVPNPDLNNGFTWPDPLQVKVSQLSQGLQTVTFTNDANCPVSVEVLIELICTGCERQTYPGPGNTVPSDCGVDVVMNGYAGTDGNHGSVFIEAPPTGLPNTIGITPSSLYVYWDDLSGSTTSLSRTDLPPGQYCATIYYVSDATGDCSSIDLCATVPEPICDAEFSTHVTPSCDGNNNGSITVYSAYTTGDIKSIIWTYSGSSTVVGSSTPNVWGDYEISGLFPTSYTGQIIYGDANCVELITVTVGESNGFGVTQNISRPNCAGDFQNGSIQVIISGGQTWGYSYSWAHDPSEHSSFITDLEPGEYQVTVTHGFTQCQEIRNYTLESSQIGVTTENNTCDIEYYCGGDLINTVNKPDYNSTFISSFNGLFSQCNTTGCENGQDIGQTSNVSFGSIMQTPDLDPCQPCRFVVSCPHDLSVTETVQGVIDWTSEPNPTTGDESCCVDIQGSAPWGSTCGSCEYRVICKFFGKNIVTDQTELILEYPMFAYADEGDIINDVPLEDDPTHNGELPGCSGMTDGGGSGQLGGINTTIFTGTVPGFQNGGRGKRGFSLGKDGAQLSASEWSLNELYPNPFDRELTLEVDSPEEEVVVLNLYDPLGRLIKAETFDLFSGTNVLRFDSGQIPTGLYILEVIDSKGNVLAQKISRD